MKNILTILFVSLGTLSFIAAWLLYLKDFEITQDEILLASILNGLTVLFFLTALFICKKVVFRATICIIFYIIILAMPLLTQFIRFTEYSIPHALTIFILFLVPFLMLSKNKDRDRKNWYKGKTPSFIGVYLILFLLSTIFKPLLSICMLIVITWGVIKYVKIEGENIIYELELFNIVIYSRRYSAGDINKLKLTRTGWMDQGSILLFNKGANVKLYNFKPKNMYQHLHQFALDHHIKLNQTKDYQMLETRRLRKEKEM